MEPSVGRAHCWPREVAYDCGQPGLAWSIRRPELGVPDGARYVTRDRRRDGVALVADEERTVTRLDEGGARVLDGRVAVRVVDRQGCP